MKILMVCLGNICRSPLAEGILQAKVAEAGLDWEIDSAGTNGYHIGEPPHHLSQKVARENGIDISTQRCRRLVKEDLCLFDRIFVMDTENYEAVKQIARENWNAEKTDRILNLLYPGEDREVPDPWYGTEKDYHLVFDMLDKACGRLVEEVKLG
ncbi:MAG: low molecular weight protein-tyrosine-phosphatase [Bacteroidota bacterium]